MDNNNSKNILEKYRAVEDALLLAFNSFNEKFAGGELQPPVIVVASDPSDKKLGHFHRNSWSQIEKNDDGEDVEVKWHEIKINARHIKERGFDVLETLLHEMAHQWNEMKGIVDVTGVRHNTKFKEAAEKFGLEVEKMGYRGWAKTSLAETGKAAVEELGFDESLFNIAFSAVKEPKPAKYITLSVEKSDEMRTMLDEIANQFENRREGVEYAIRRLHTEEVAKND